MTEIAKQKIHSRIVSKWKTTLWILVCCSPLALKRAILRTHKDEIIGRANIIEAAGKLAIPIVCWNAGFDKEEGNFAYEVGEERTNLLNFGAILHLYQQR